MIIDGISQPGFHGLPLVELDGSQAGPVDGLHITGGGSLVRGLVIHSFQYGIELSGLGGNQIEGNFIGTDVTGTGAMSELIDVYVNVSPDNLIGGTTAAARNVIGSLDINSYDADANIVNSQSGGNRIEGNYIGSDLTGTALLPASRNWPVRAQRETRLKLTSGMWRLNHRSRRIPSSSSSTMKIRASLTRPRLAKARARVPPNVRRPGAGAS